MRRALQPGLGLIFAGVALLSVTMLVMLARSGDLRGQYGYWGWGDPGTHIDASASDPLVDCPAGDDCKIAYIYSDPSGYWGLAPNKLLFVDCDDSTCTQRKPATFLQGFNDAPLMDLDCPLSHRCSIAWIDVATPSFHLKDCTKTDCSQSNNGLAYLPGVPQSMDMECPSYSQCRIALSIDSVIHYIMCQYQACTLANDIPALKGTDVDISCVNDQECTISFKPLNPGDPSILSCRDSFCHDELAEVGGGETIWGDISCLSRDSCKILNDASLETMKDFINCSTASCSQSFSKQVPDARQLAQDLICTESGGCFMYNSISRFTHCADSTCASYEQTRKSIYAGTSFDLACSGERCKIAYADGTGNLYFYSCADSVCSSLEQAASSQSSVMCPEILPPPGCDVTCTSSAPCNNCQVVCSSASSEGAASSAASSGGPEQSSGASSSSRSSRASSSVASQSQACGPQGAVCVANSDCCSLSCFAGNCAPPVIASSASSGTNQSSAPSSASPAGQSSSRSSAGGAPSSANPQPASSSRVSSAISSRRFSAAAGNVSSAAQPPACRNNGAACTGNAQCCSNVCGNGVCMNAPPAASSASSARLSQLRSSSRPSQQLPPAQTPVIPAPLPGEPTIAYEPPVPTAMNSAYCGNGIREGEEECDDANLNDADRCSTTCRLARCGDRIRQSGEQCDDGNLTPGDGCSQSCAVEPKLQLERTPLPQPPAPAAPRPASSAAASTPAAAPVQPQPRSQETQAAAPSVEAPLAACGDGRREGIEECDDGNVFAADGCSAQCTREYCGNARIDPNESCDRGAENSNLPDSLCRPDCTLGRCGDGIIDFGEECDDGNRTSGDRCSDRCKIEPPPSQILPASFFETPLAQQQPFYPSAPFVQPQLTSAYIPQDPVPSVPETGPGALAFMAAGGAAGFAWFKRRRRL